MAGSKNIVGTQALAFTSQLLPAIIGVLSFMLLVRHAKPEVLGQYVIYMAAVVLFEMIKSGGLQSALVMRLSGCNQEQQLVVNGSAYWLGAMISLSLSLVLGGLYLSGLFENQTAIQVFCGWYALVGLFTVPLHIAEASAVARQDLSFLLWLRLVQSTNALLIAVYALFKGGTLKNFATVHLIFTFFLLVAVLAFRKTNPLQVKFKTRDEVKKLVHLIKYTLATLATTNLLKSADTFLIGSLMGPVSVAKYAVPLKLTELFEIPLRSLSTTAFPHLAAKNNEKDNAGFKQSFTQYLSWVYMLYIPALLFAFIMAPYIVTFIGGHRYAGTTPIFRVFILYGLLLPTDRLTGISLDALQMPSRNFKKVLIMASVNILGDLLAITLTHQLVWVAFASAINAATGAILGWWMLENTGVLAPGKVWQNVYDYSSLLLIKQVRRFKQAH